MPYTTIEIKGYRGAMFSSAENPSKISLYDAQNKNFASAYIRPESETLPQAYQDSSGRYRLYFHRPRFSELIDLLRNEKPMYVHFWEGAGNNTHIATTREPVGEEET